MAYSKAKRSAAAKKGWRTRKAGRRKAGRAVKGSKIVKVKGATFRCKVRRRKGVRMTCKKV